MARFSLNGSLARVLLVCSIITLAAYAVAAPNLSRPTPREMPFMGPGKVVTMVFTGKLVKQSPIDRESTGWALLLDSNVKFDGKHLERIEVDPLTTDVDGFENKSVEIKGRPSWALGNPERGFFLLIEIGAIREVAS